MSRETSVTLGKETAKGRLLWTITINKDDYSTQIQTGLEGCRGRKLVPHSHRNISAARMNMDQQIRLKTKQGFVRNNKRELSDEEGQEESWRAFDTPEPHERGAVDFSFRPTGVKRKFDFNHEVPESRGRKRMRRTMEEEVTLANMRADAMKRGERAPMEEEEEDSDTASLASSEASFVRNKRYTGVSPLRRRRSVRLAIKRDASVMDTIPGLSRQNTVDMTTPLEIQRMDTDSKWSNWRRDDNTAQLRRGRSSMRMDTLPLVKEESVSVPRLLKRMSTTTGLRQMFEKTGLETKIEIPNVFADSPAQGSTDPQEPTATTTLKRLGRGKSINVMPLVEEGESTGEDEADGATAATSPPAKLPFKRFCKSPLSPPGEELLPSKRRKVGGANDQEPMVYQPPGDESCPVAKIAAQVVWRAGAPEPATDPLVGLIVMADICYIATKCGKVLKLSASVQHDSTVELPHPIRFIASHENKVICACSGGRFYDVTGAEAQLVYDLKNKSQVLGLEVYKDRLYICKPKGLLLVYNLHNKELIKISTKKNLSDWIGVDDSGIYVGHVDGISKFAHTSGSLLWDKVLPGKPIRAALHHGNLLVASHEVVIIDGNTGKKLGQIGELTGNGDESSGAQIAVGGGLIFHFFHTIRCCDCDSGRTVYDLTPPSPTCLCIKFYKGRLFFVEEGGVSAIDFSPDVINAAMRGETLGPVDVPLGAPAPGRGGRRSALKRQSTTLLLKRGGSKRDHTDGPSPRKRCLLKSKALTLGDTSLLSALE